jgi:hypothetical protein
MWSESPLPPGAGRLEGRHGVPTPTQAGLPPSTHFLSLGQAAFAAVGGGLFPGAGNAARLCSWAGLVYDPDCNHPLPEPPG